MRLISSLLVSLALSACATDYTSQLYEPNYGIRSLHYSPADVDPIMLMNGTYASKQINGLYEATPLNAVCLTNYRCSPEARQPPSGWDP